MAVLAKVSTLRKRLPSVLVDPCLYYCCTTHQALAALRSLCTESCARTVRSTWVGVRNVICEFIWTTATVLFAQVRTGFFDAYCMSCSLQVTYCTCMYMYVQDMVQIYQSYRYVCILEVHTCKCSYTFNCCACRCGIPFPHSQCRQTANKL